MNNDFAKIINRLNQMSANNFANTVSLFSLVYTYQINNPSHTALRTLFEKNKTYNQNYRDRSM